jgi:hemoglobin
MEESTLYDRVGGQAFFDELVEFFYVAVEQEESIRPMYPEDLTESKKWLALFLAQYYGGPSTYQSERGHPRLRLRHAPFRITKKARDAWLRAMTFALENVADQLSDDDLFEMTAYFDMAAKSLRNV